LLVTIVGIDVLVILAVIVGIDVLSCWYVGAVIVGMLVIAFQFA